jgi:hypothetical protein
LLVLPFRRVVVARPGRSQQSAVVVIRVDVVGMMLIQRVVSNNVDQMVMRL